MSSTNLMHEWFKYLFEQRCDVNGFVTCFECGKPMHINTYLEDTKCYSHLLEKSRYPQFAGDPQNVVIVHGDCHNLYTMKPKKAVNQYNEYLRLKEKYNV